MVRTLLDSSPAPRPSLHVTFAGRVLPVDTIICSSLSSPTILLFTHRDHRPLTTILSTWSLIAWSIYERNRYVKNTAGIEYFSFVANLFLQCHMNLQVDNIIVDILFYDSEEHLWTLDSHTDYKHT